MKHTLNRRLFLKRAALAAGALSTASLFPGCAAPAVRRTGNRLNCVQIGCGNRAMTHLEWVVSQSKENLVAIVDPDEKRLTAIKRWLQSKNQNPAKVTTFTDYRRMFDKMGKEIDAVFIATPNHQHAPPAMLAMELGVGVYCEKPLCHDIAEARQLRKMALQAKAPTQMGNQGHCEDGYRRLCEFVAAGVVGPITETHSWTDRANGGLGPRPPALPVPADLHWEEWLGPAPYRPYHADLHPHQWHGWHDFGNGSLGNMGCHVLDGVFWALQVEHPTAIELEQVRDGTDERFPTGCRLRYDIPARGQLPALKAYWYEGLKPGASLSAIGKIDSVQGEARNQPPLLGALKQQFPDEEFDSNGTLYVGQTGILYTSTYGAQMRVVPFEKMQTMKQPPRTLPRPRNVMADFLDACRAGKRETAASFDYAARLTEFTLLGNLAQRAGLGQKVEWDGPNMKVTSHPELNEWIKRPCRAGWKTS